MPDAGELPANLPAERSVLGPILLRPSLLDACLHAGLRPEDFSLKANAQIFATIICMGDEGKPIDSLLVCEELHFEQAGEHGYVADLTTGVIVLESHVVERCRVLIRNAQLRRIIAIAETLDLARRRRGAVPEDIITGAVQNLTSIFCFPVLSETSRM